MAHEDVLVKDAKTKLEADIFAEKFSSSIAKVLFQVFGKCVVNQLDYIGDQLKDIKESMQKIAASLKEVSDK